MKKAIIALAIWLCFCIPCFAAIDAETVYSNHLSEFSFVTEESREETLRKLDSFINRNNEIIHVRYYWRDGRWDVQVAWKPSVKILTGQQLTDSEQRTKKEAEKVLNSIVSDGMSDYQKVYEIYNWIQDKTDYDYEAAKQKRYRHEKHPADNANGVLFNGKAVCGGYADAFYLLSNMAGIDSYFVLGDNHCWNIVQLRGEWYYIDVTDESGKCFLRGTEWLEKNGYVTECYIPVEISKTDYAF